MESYGCFPGSQPESDLRRSGDLVNDLGDAAGEPKLLQGDNVQDLVHEALAVRQDGPVQPLGQCELEALRPFCLNWASPIAGTSSTR